MSNLAAFPKYIRFGTLTRPILWGGGLMICYILAVYFIFYQNIHRVHFVNYNWQKKLWLWSKSNRHITYNFENWQKKADFRSSDDSAITDDTFSLFQEAANAETWKNNFQCIYIFIFSEHNHRFVFWQGNFDTKAAEKKREIRRIVCMRNILLAKSIIWGGDLLTGAW